MRYSQLQAIVGKEPLFESALLTSGTHSAYQVQRRLADWAKANKITPLRRGLYVLPAAQRAIEPHPFVVANRLMTGSYVSLEMALRYYSLIPEHVAVVTNVTTGRPGTWDNEFGRFRYRHIHQRYFFGMEYRLMIQGQSAYIAYPEKALLDLLYLRQERDLATFIESLRLQNLEQLDLGRLRHFAERFQKAKLQRAVSIIAELVAAEAAEYEPL